MSATPPGHVPGSGDFGEPSDGVLAYQRATEVANKAFAAGWIDLEELDRRLAGISNADSGEVALRGVSDLSDFTQRLDRERDVDKRAQEAVARRNSFVRLGLSIPFYVVALASAMNVVIWWILYVSGTALYFWPAWMAIPLLVTFVLYVAGGRFFGGDDGVGE